MTKQTRTILKGYFESGDVPNQSQYVDLIDSKLNLAETGIQIVNGTLSSSFLEVQNHITASGNILVQGTYDGHITASGNISASGYVSASNASINTNLVVGNRVTSNYGTVNYGLTVNELGHGGGDFRVESADNAYMIWSDAGTNKIAIGTVTPTSTLTVNGDFTSTHITASDNISASYTSTGSLGSLMLTTLPTTEPTTTGSVWISGSSAAHPNSGYLMIFNP